MYYTTGFSRCEIEDLCALIVESQSSTLLTERLDWPPILGLGNSVVVTLTYLRRNRVQWELAETYGVSQSTISRAITVITPLLRAGRRGPGGGAAVPRGWDAAPVLVVVGPSGPVLG